MLVKIYLQKLEHFFFPILLSMAAYCLFWLLRDNQFNRKQLWFTSQWNKGLKIRIIIFVISVFLIALAVVSLSPENFIGLVREKPLTWLLIMIVYPAFSATSQEIIYRAFFFQRYKNLFPTTRILFTGSVLAFGWAHIFFGNWLAILLSTIGGILFGITYLQTKSLLVCAIEHSLYGCLIFTIGLGEFFYHGSSKALGG